VSRSPGVRPPAVERLLAAVRPRLAESREPAALVAAARELIAEERERIGDGAAGRDLDALADVLLARFAAWAGDSRSGARVADGSTDLVRVINATGVILHTNLGRAPWPAAALEAARAAGAGYPLLELDRASGRRGARFRAAEAHLIALSRAQDALVTNNNAAALALAVGLAGRGGRVAVSRGELVEIGGSVRIPEIIRRAGARLVEVGTTNRTRAIDFADALAGGQVKVVLRVHPSNFVIAGFTESPDPAEVAELAHRHGAILVDDLGSGALLATERFGLAHEPMPSERLAAGADVVTFSGDKLVGGPQAGLVVGRADLVARLRRDPLARAMRPDKSTMAGVAATLGLYRAGLATSRIPVWQMIAAKPAVLHGRAKAILHRLPATLAEAARVGPLESTIGGGSLPGETLPSFGLVIRARSADKLLAALRTGEPCIVGRISDGAVVLDLRTVQPEDDDALPRGIGAALAGGA
jgi:L-seryl-tRNA(Ser) seleniumtransferase